MKRTIVFWLYFVIAIVLGIYFATRIIMTGLGHGNLATIHNITITTDDSDMDMVAVQTVAAGGLGARTNSLNIDSLNRRIATVPGIKNSATRRMPNGTLRIYVQPYHAVALWTDGDSYYPLSGDGTIVQTPLDARDDGAIVFRGKLPDDISEITTATHTLAQHINYLEWIENRRWNIITTGGITVMLPENDAVAAVRGLNSLNEAQRILDKNIKIIDMRDPSRILVK